MNGSAERQQVSCSLLRRHSKYIRRLRIYRNEVNYTNKQVKDL